MFDWAAAILQIILIDIVLSGDNAIVIALATRHLPSKQRRLAIFFGTFAAVALRVLLTFVVSFLIKLPGLRFAGALMLAWIACEVVREEEEELEHPELVDHTMRTAIFRIVVADFVMSLDNVVAVAGVSKSNLGHLIFGLLLSIAIILAFSSAILALMNRFRWITFLGAAVLGLTAFGMMREDLDEFDPARWYTDGRYHLATWGKWAICGLAIALVAGLNWCSPKIKARWAVLWGRRPVIEEEVTSPP